MVFEEKILQSMVHQESRTKLNMQTAQLDYHHDYFIKDHLGNVRMVLTDEQRTDIYPAATLEGNINTDKFHRIFQYRRFFSGIITKK